MDQFHQIFGRNATNGQNYHLTVTPPTTLIQAGSHSSLNQQKGK